ncbi:hydroxyacid dehydrogenase [Candidatus Pacearchaeota archaeon]|nr:hydroxyacid dehydrogenase [Candidatus Pacearchaeota archaeon]
MKISFFEIQGWEKPILKKILKGHSLNFFKEPLSINNINQAKNSDVISIFIYSKINKQILSKLPKLKLITTRSTGFDHIDLTECRKRKILLYNVPAYGENTVAEHTFALLLALSRKIHQSYLRTIRNDFSIGGLKGFDLKGKTLGVLGVGRIGKHVVRIARGFEMNVLASDPHPDNFLAEELNFKYVSFQGLLKKSDIVTLHIPYTKENHHLFNKKNFNMMKKGSIIINTSRGAIIDTEALIWALDKKIISGVGLDVLEGEALIKEEKQLLYDKKKITDLQELVKDHILLAKENVVFTPHIAFYSQEALERIIEQTAENIKSFIGKKPSKECVVC